MIHWIHESRGFLTLSEDFVSKRQHGRVHVPRVGRLKFASLSTRPTQNRFSLGSYRRSNRVAVPRDREPLRAILGGWGGRIRTFEWRLQRPLPYHLATPQCSTNSTRSKKSPETSEELHDGWCRFAWPIVMVVVSLRINIEFVGTEDEARMTSPRMQAMVFAIHAPRE